MKTKITTSLAILLYLLTILPANAASDSHIVRHELSFPRVLNQYVHVASTFPAAGEVVELAMPVWTPGCYLIREFSAHVEGLRVTDSAGVSLAVRKTTKNRWSVETSGASEISVEYDIWAGRLSVCANWVEPSLALLNGSGVFLYTAQSRTLPQEVSVRLPASWSTVHTSMDAVGPDSTFLAADFDELVDSPIVAGNSVEHTFEVNGQSYGLVFSSDNRYWDFERAVEDVTKLIKTQQAFWGVNPLSKKYLFMTLFMGKDGGLEHDHSTVLLIEGMAMRKRDRYRRWLGLVSHELLRWEPHG